MMWDLSGGSRLSTASIAMPSPAFPEPSHHEGRPSSVPGAYSPGWTNTGAPSPMPMGNPVSFLNSEPEPYTYQPVPRGVLRHPPPPVHRHHTPQPAKHHQQVQFAPQPPPHRHAVQAMPAVVHRFQYSKCTGRRKALCIGINYRGQSHELRGCINDAKHVFSFLVRRKGYRPEDIVVLTDDSPHQNSQPTRKNIIEAMRWLVSDAHTHDALFFHYSGHGGQTRDLDDDEVDGYDEVIYPVDYKQNGHILDDEMNALMVKSLPTGCRLTAVFDSCHSGTVLDLPYIYSSHGRLKGSHVSARARQRKATEADVISLSGCKDGQTSADTFSEGEAVGAASHAFIKVVEEHPRASYQELLHHIRLILNPKFSQKPQLSSSHPIDTSLRFIM